jgi:parvulin-like peptidyl-prolyl isomerase
VLAALAAPLLAAQAPASRVCRTVAYVNNEAITSIELDRVLAPYEQQLAERLPKEEVAQEMVRARHDALEQLIDRKLLLAAAKQQDLAMPEIEIDKKVDEYRARYATPEDFQTFLDQQNMTLSELRTTIEEDLKVKVLFQDKVARRVTVLPGELHEYYHRHIDEFTRPAQVHMYQILIKNKPDERTALLRAREVQKELKSGANFQQVARQFSDDPKRAQGGDWGLISEGYFGDDMAAVEKAAFKLHPGEFSGIIPTRYGFHIVYIDRKKPRHTMTEAQAYDEIYAKLFNQKLATVYKDYMRYLRDKNFVEIVDAGGAAARAATAGTPDFSLSSP